MGIGDLDELSQNIQVRTRRTGSLHLRGAACIGQSPARGENKNKHQAGEKEMELCLTRIHMDTSLNPDVPTVCVAGVEPNGR